MLPVKVCGITRAEDALLAAELGAAAVGFVFYARSPRFINAGAARRIAEQLPPAVARVGVFVNPDPETLTLIAQRAGLTHVQLCGEEDAQRCAASPRPVLKVLRAAPEDFPKALRHFPAAAFLVDGGKAGGYGGTGTKSDWDFCRQLREIKFTILAGGLAPHNIAAAVSAAQPDALDVSSALESRPGRKDRQKMRAFFAALEALPAAPSRLQNGFFALT